MLVTLTPEQIKILENTTKMKVLSDLMVMYLSDYYKENKDTMKKKRKSNIEFIMKHSVAYMNDVDQLLDRLREQVKV